jgi:SAM-dependent methyltransferase
VAGIYEELAEIYERAGFTRFSRTMAPRVLELLRRYGGWGQEVRRICDLACGTGEAAVYLAQRGYEVIGIDVSARMLAQARAKGEAAGVSVQWLQADARNFVLQRPVDAVTCMYDALNYMLTEEDLAAVFRCVRDCLAPGGLFLFDMNTRAGLAEEWGTGERVEAPDDDVMLIWQTSYDHETDVNTLVLTAFVRQPGGLYRRIREVHRERGYPVAQVRRLLGDAGLEVLAVGDIELRPLRGDTERFLCVARRRD